MKRLLSALCASAIAVSVGVTGMIPAQAAPVPSIAVDTAGNGLPIIKVQSNEQILRRKFRQDRREFRQDRREFRRDRREFRGDMRQVRNERRGYYRGHRGYRDYRPGYKRHGDFWYPAAAFIAGAAIGGIIANQPSRVVRTGGAHTEWCYNRYRSYRASDNTFQPYNGPRQQCYSPYS